MKDRANVRYSGVKQMVIKHETENLLMEYATVSKSPVCIQSKHKTEHGILTTSIHLNDFLTFADKIREGLEQEAYIYEGQ